jgi:hypothetical protein
VRWLDPEGLESKANPLPRFVLRPERRIASEVGGIPRVICAKDAAHSDLDDAPVVDIAAALRRQVQNDPGKSDLVVLFLFCTFPSDENLTSSLPSSQLPPVFSRQEKRSARSLRLSASATSILVNAESAPSDDFN